MENNFTIRVEIETVCEDTNGPSKNTTKSLTLIMPTTYEALIGLLGRLEDVDLIKGNFLVFFWKQEDGERLVLDKNNYNQIGERIKS